MTCVDSSSLKLVAPLPSSMPGGSTLSLCQAARMYRCVSPLVRVRVRARVRLRVRIRVRARVELGLA